MEDEAVTQLVLPPDAHSVRRARDVVRRVFQDADPADLLDGAVLAVSELATNAVLHAGTEVTLRVWVRSNAIRVELRDRSVHGPVRRPRPALAGTGRGLQIVEEYVDRWGVTPTANGKSVWFEIGEPVHAVVAASTEEPVADEEQVVRVSLRHVPLLMHWAWQEHASSLLREYLLAVIEQDPLALEVHAEASEALSALDEQVPQPALPADTEQLLVRSTEPEVTSDEVVLLIPRESVPTFATLDRLLTEAVAAASSGRLLGPPTQPEIAEMRRWLCGEVAAQAAGPAAPTPWGWAGGDTGAAHAGVVDTDAYRELITATEPMIVANEQGDIVAATEPALTFLGYPDASELVGRRILTIIPERYHQAHVAGLTLHATSGRDALLDRWITAPVVRADGSEAPIELRIERHRLGDDERAFVATLRLP